MAKKKQERKKTPNEWFIENAHKMTVNQMADCTELTPHGVRSRCQRLKLTAKRDSFRRRDYVVPDIVAESDLLGLDIDMALQFIKGEIMHPDRSRRAQAV